MEEQEPPKSVLVCEDDKGWRRILCARLEKMGYRIAGEAETGVESVNRFVETEPDIVLLDLKMPEGDGLTVLRFVRELNNEVRVVMITADNTPHAVQTALRLGANDYIIKGPLTNERFLRALGEPAPPNE
ncbi:MAG TPA: response regulator [bacterium]|nr:response regulator [bacterium]HQP97479.1 response regulator [bacterium]